MISLLFILHYVYFFIHTDKRHQLHFTVSTEPAILVHANLIVVVFGFNKLKNKILGNQAYISKKACLPFVVLP